MADNHTRLGPELADGAEPTAAETHSAVVFFVGDRAFKMKKPVDLGFLDFSSLTAREQACSREVALNRRLAPGVYLGVADVLDGDGQRCDHLVVMRRMPTERCLTRLVENGADVGECVRSVAGEVADFHRETEMVDRPAEYAGPEAVRANWEDNREAISDHPEVVEADRREAVAELARCYLAGRGPLLAERIDHGRVRDGHGDLMADDIFCLDEGPAILDCLDFAERYRCGDVLLDAAFLVMDLERLGRPDLGRSFLDSWRGLLGERYPDSLAHHYIAYRAHVRAKVACLRAEQGLQRATATARQLHDLAERHLQAARIRLVLIGGAPGTGKTSLAQGLSDATGWVLLRSDVARKELAGLDQRADAGAAEGQGLYTEQMTDATYGELIDRAKQRLARGESVIVDATWARTQHRERAAHAAAETSSELIALRCEAPVEVAERRIESRGADASDASPQLAASLAAGFEAWPEAVPVETTGSVDGSVESALGWLGRIRP